MCNYLTSSVSHIFHKTLLLLKTVTDKLWSLHLGYWAGFFFFFFYEQYVLLSSRESLQVFVANDRTEGFKQKLNLKSFTCHHELDSFPILKHYSDDISSNINKYDFRGANYIMKCVNITLWINILQGTNVIYYKITHGKNTHLFNL